MMLFYLSSKKGPNIFAEATPPFVKNSKRPRNDQMAKSFFTGKLVSKMPKKCHVLFEWPLTTCGRSHLAKKYLFGKIFHVTARQIGQNLQPFILNVAKRP
jgi:hypothetical protein